MKITKNRLLNDVHLTGRIIFLSIFAFCGIMIPFIPFITLKEININSIISFLVLFCIFGIPFGYFIGIRNVVYSVRVNHSIKNGNFYILEDEIIDFYATQDESSPDSHCKIELKIYSEKTNKIIPVKYKAFRKLKKGDKCFLVFVQFSKKPVIVYPGNEYFLDDELETRLRQDMR